MNETISTCYATFPPTYRQHWMEVHHSVDQILAKATEGLTQVMEYVGNIMGTRNIVNNRIQSIMIPPDMQPQGYGTELLQHTATARTICTKSRNPCGSTIGITASSTLF